VVQVPTTMTAQVDSALGGKTGVNLRAAKNLVGAFHQPRLIVADVTTLLTLPEREFREGLAEVIKYGAIMDAPMIAALETAMPAILARDPDELARIVDQSLRHKAAVVASDEREGGLRKILNFGHTIGHALEASAGYGSYFHGEAIAIGMVAESADPIESCRGVPIYFCNFVKDAVFPRKCRAKMFHVKHFRPAFAGVELHP